MFGCSSKISPFARANEYHTDIYIHIENGALKLYMKSPADIEYIKNRRRINKGIKKHFEGVKGSLLVYGTTEFPPYEVSLWLSEEPIVPKADQISRDTLVDGTIFTLVGVPRDKKAAKPLEADIGKMMESMVFGENFDQIEKD